jgi:uncharacterized protein (TIGR02145 family)
MNFKIKMPRISVIFLISLFFLLASCNKSTIPSVATAPVNRIQQTNAYSGGQIANDGDSHVSKLGVCWSTSANPTISDNTTQDTLEISVYSSHITGLTPKTLYYVRAYATNSEGTAYGNQVSFTTPDLSVPSLTTSVLKSITFSTASGGGDITNDGGIPVTARGVCWSTTINPTIADSHTSEGDGPGQFFSTLTDLSIGMTYHVRAYATNSMGTAYGNELAFTQMEPLLDIDGNTYSVITIGTQVWFGENLKTTKYNDGGDIPLVSEGHDWAITSTPAFCWYNNNQSSFGPTYGALYNWHAVNTGKICPTGWHVPSADEYNTLLVNLGGVEIAGVKLKEAGFSHWAFPNDGATNESGFTALPGGGRYTVLSNGGVYSDIGYVGYHWSATSSTNISNAYSFDMTFNSNRVIKSEYSKMDGGAVRCIKDAN